MAEGLLKAAVKDQLSINVKSAGVSAANGHPMSQNTSQILRGRNASVVDFASQLVNASLLGENTLVIAMTESHAMTLKHHFPECDVKLICDFIDEKEGLAGVDLPDPYGMDIEAYEEVAEVIELALPGILAELGK